MLYGKPVVKNTRIPVDLLLEKMANGETMEELLQAYPRLDRGSIFASLAFAADSIKNEVETPNFDNSQILKILIQTMS